MPGVTGTIAAVLALTLSSTAGSDLAGDVAAPTAQIRFVGEPDLRLHLHQTSAGHEADVLGNLPHERTLLRPSDAALGESWITERR